MPRKKQNTQKGEKEEKKAKYTLVKQLELRNDVQRTNIRIKELINNEDGSKLFVIQKGKNAIFLDPKMMSDLANQLKIFVRGD